MSTVASYSQYYTRITKLLSDSKNTDDKQLFTTITNAPFHDKFHTTNLDLGMIVFVLADTKHEVINRISYSDTNPAIDAVRASPKPFNEILIPLHNKLNLTARAIETGQPQKTSDWMHLFRPVLKAEAARFNQAEAGMGCSFVYPLTNARDGGALIFSFYQPISMIGACHQTFMKNYALLVSDMLRV